MMKTLKVLTGAVALACLAGCAPVLIGGAAVGGTAVAVDRRTSGDILDDQGIELRASRQIHERIHAAHVNVTSWNARVLLTGEVPTPNDRQIAEQITRSVPGVREVVNDLGVMPASSMLTRTQDSVLTGRVKAAIAGNPNVSAKDVKVVTERGSVYLMGRVTREEGAAASDAASLVSGVQRVVRVFEYGTPTTVNANSWSNTSQPVPEGMPAVGESGGSFYQTAPLNPPTGTGSDLPKWYPATPSTSATPAAPAVPAGGYTQPVAPATGGYTAAPVTTHTSPAAPAVYTPPAATTAPVVQDLAPLPVQTAPVSNSPLR